MTGEQLDDRLPIESDSQRIGQNAVQAFNANYPHNWRPIPVDGDSDFGLDQQVQVVDANKRVSGGIFHVQIKGSETPRISANGDYISVTLKTKTLNYYARIGDPIMLVFVDLSSGEFPKDCKVHWLWLSDEIDRLLVGSSDFSEFDNDSITIRIPTRNLLSPDFDVLPRLIEFKRQRDAVAGFVNAIGSYKEVERSTADTVQDITAKLDSAGPQLVKSLTDSSDSPWIDPPKGSLQEKLYTASVLLAQNNDVEADAVLDDIRTDLETTNSHERAEYFYLRGRVLSLRSQDQAALDEYERASAEYPNSEKYVAAVLETRFRGIFPEKEGSGQLERLIAEFPNSGGDRLMALKARLQFAIGDYVGAEETLENVGTKDAVVPRVLALYLQEKWDQVISACESELSREPVRIGMRGILHVLLARSYFYSAISGCDMSDDPVLPPFGLPGIDLERLQKCWDVSLVALKILREHNWPTNSEHVVDIVGHVGPVLGQAETILNDLQALSRARPNIAITHEHLARLAALTKNHEIENEALAALEKTDDVEETVHLRIHSLYSQKRYQQALELAEQHLIGANEEHVLHSSCLGIAAICAHECLEPGRGSPFLEKLASRKEWAGDLAVYDFVVKANSSPLEREKAVDEFVAAYKALPDSKSIQDNLFDALDATNAEQAELCIEVGGQIRQRRLLSSNEVFHLAQSYTTLARWDLLLALADEAIAQYGHMSRTAAMKAIALDGLGDTAAAAAILEDLIAQHPDEDLAITSYVNICIRTGFHDKAALQLEALLQKASTHDQRLTYLRQLFALRFSVDPNDARLVELAWRYGSLNDQGVEREEGIFLQLFIAATFNEGVVVAEERVAEFRERAERYFQAWPNSAVIRRFELPGPDQPGEFVAALERAVGITQQQKDLYKNLENQLSDGRIAAPFCWRPRKLLASIANVAHLWWVAKNSTKDARAYHLTIDSDVNRKTEDLSFGPKRIPLLDLTTLMVLYDLDIYEYLFSVFPSIAISVETALEIQQLAHPFLGGYENIAGIRDFLKRNTEKILQPSAGASDKSDRFESESLSVPLEEIRALAATGRYSPYIDDAAARLYVSEGTDCLQTITTLDFLEELERRELLSTREVGEKLSLLTRWNVGVVIRKQHFLSVLPGEVDRASGLDDLIGILTSENAFKDLVDGVWDIKREYPDVLRHIAAILADIAKGPRVSAELVAAIWEVWNIKVELRGLDIDKARHRASTLIRTVSFVREHKQAVKKLWDAYVMLTERQHGSRMDIAKEKEARKLVGSVAAGIVQSREDTTIGSDILAALLLPFVSGTSEYDLVNQAYVQARISAVDSSE